MRGLPTSIGGLIVPTLTPLTADEELDCPAFERHLGFLIDAGADAIFVLGSNGEGAMLRPSVRLAVTKEALRIAGDKIPVICGVLETSTTRVVDEILEMRGLGLAGYVVTAPLYYDRFAEIDLLQHFTTIAGKADAPIFVYSIPRFAAWFSQDLIRRLADSPNIGGLKDSSEDWSSFQGLLLRRPREDFALLQGSHSLTAVSLFAGCDGLVPGFANLHPTLFVELLRAAREYRWSDVLELQTQLNEFLTIRGDGRVHANKVLAQALGLMDDHVTSPLPRLDAEAAASLVRESVAAGLPLPDLSASLPRVGS